MTTGREREYEQVRRSRKRVTRRASMLDQEARDKAAAALAKSEAHEQLCTERWEAQAKAMGRIEETMKAVNDAINDKIGKLPAGVIAGLTAAVGFLAARVWPAH